LAATAVIDVKERKLLTNLNLKPIHLFIFYPLILANHQRKPTKRNRQSLKNSGGLPSKA
jgi:hypothetical protein